MEIKIKDQRRPCTFLELKAGDYFLIKQQLYVKLNESKCFSFSSYKEELIKHYTKVAYVKNVDVETDSDLVSLSFIPDRKEFIFDGKTYIKLHPIHGNAYACYSFDDKMIYNISRDINVIRCEASVVVDV